MCRSRRSSVRFGSHNRVHSPKYAESFTMLLVIIVIIGRPPGYPAPPRGPAAASTGPGLGSPPSTRAGPRALCVVAVHSGDGISHVHGTAGVGGSSHARGAAVGCGPRAVARPGGSSRLPSARVPGRAPPRWRSDRGCAIFSGGKVHPPCTATGTLRGVEPSEGLLLWEPEGLAAQGCPHAEGARVNGSPGTPGATFSAGYGSRPRAARRGCFSTAVGGLVLAAR